MMVGKLASVWNMPLFSMSAMRTDLRSSKKYSTLVRVSTPSNRFATALLMFCQHNDVRALFTFVSSGISDGFIYHSEL